MRWIVVSIIVHLFVVFFIPFSYFQQDKSSSIRLTYRFKKITAEKFLEREIREKENTSFPVIEKALYREQGIFEKKFSPLYSVSREKKRGIPVKIITHLSFPQIQIFSASPQVDVKAYQLKKSNKIFSLEGNIFSQGNGSSLIIVKKEMVFSTGKKVPSSGPIHSQTFSFRIPSKRAIYLREGNPRPEVDFFSPWEDVKYLRKPSPLKEKVPFGVYRPRKENVYPSSIMDQHFLIRYNSGTLSFNPLKKLSSYPNVFGLEKGIISRFSPVLKSFPWRKNTIHFSLRRPMLPPGEDGEKVFLHPPQPRKVSSLPGKAKAFPFPVVHYPLFNTRGVASKARVFPLKSSDISVSIADYLKKVIEIIQKNKKYPSSARKKGIEGKVGISFTLSRDGEVVSVEVVSPSRYSELNKATQKLIYELSPFPPFPTGMNEKIITLKMEVIYELKEEL